MKDFKILILTLAVVIPGFVLAQTQTSVDSTTINDVVDNKEVQEVDEAEIKTVETEENEAVVESAETETMIETVSTYDNIRIVTDSYNEIDEEQKIVESELRDEIKDGIDESIIEIRSQENIEAYKLQGAVSEKRTEIYNDINTTFSNTSPTDLNSIIELKNRVNNAITDIENALESVSGVDVDLSDNATSIKNTFLRYEKIIEEKKIILQEREGELIEMDTDNDGLSDYDEKFIYNTNPESPYTVEEGEGGLTDAEKIAAGINPSDPEGKAIEYQDPRDDQKSVISKVHKLKRVELVTKEGEVGKRLQLSGSALPNSYVTVYIFSTPTIVTVRTDERGEWTYTLDKELENGQHDVYVATVDNTGRLIARSESIPITKSDEAATLGTFGIGEPAPAPNDFVQENFILIILAILLFAVIVVLILSGGSKKDDVEFVAQENNGNSNVPPVQASQTSQASQAQTPPQTSEGESDTETKEKEM